jgi:site-specific DNA-methyltransferase (adenine-specific)
MKVTEKINITNECNMELMSRYEDNHFDLAIVDPPYGININNSMGRRKGTRKSDYKKVTWDNEIPTKEYFIELKRVSENQIIWGANYFELPPSSCWIVWDKWISEKMSFAQCELAYTSFKGSTKLFRKVNNGTNRTSTHPTAKPEALYEWLLMKYAKEGDKILDTHLGSGSIALACHNLKYDLTACELDTEYYNASIKRLQSHVNQQRLF